MSILICKIYDERYKSADSYMEFIVIDNDPKKTSERVKNIFENFNSFFELEDKLKIPKNEY